MADQIDTCQQVMNEAHAMIASAQASDFTKPTPCEGWDARALVDHMIGVVRNFTAAFGSEALTPATGQSPAGLSGDDPAGSYQQAADALLRAVRMPGALERPVAMPVGEMPGTLAINIVIGDQMIHTWDLAKALGRPYSMDDERASAVLAMMQRLVTPDRRGAGRGFAEEVPCPDNASIQDRLLAFSGRQP